MVNMEHQKDIQSKLNNRQKVQPSIHKMSQLRAFASKQASESEIKEYVRDRNDYIKYLDNGANG